MPVQELGPHFQFASWRIPQFPRAIEYPLEVMEEIRAYSCDELLQLSHGGDEVGGVLFGTRRDELIRILTWRPIACDHTQGEGLRLSYNDRMNLAVQLEMARQNPDLKDLRPLGWFVSHPRGDVSMSASDLEIYSGFFPEAWQIALVICPKQSGHAQAGFFVREAEDKLQSEASYHCFDLQPLQLAPIAADIAPVPETEAAPPPLPPVRKPKDPEPAKPPQTPPQSSSAPSLPSPAIPSPALEAPSFQMDEPVPTKERWLWAIPIVLALGIAGFMLYQRRTPPPSASIALRALSEAQTVQLTWDANSSAIHDSDRGEIAIDDGAKHSQVSLTGDQLHAGKMSYLPQSSDVGFSMTVYPANGDPIHDYTRLIAPAFNAPTQPPQLLPSSPPPASPPDPAPSEQPELQREVQQLKEDLGKERARADGLQNLVRILENRLGIKAEPEKAPRR